MPDNTALREKTIKGLLWSSSDIITGQGIRFVIQIFLARMLMPEDFGMIGMITIFIAISQIMSDSGFQKALIREDNSTQTDYSTVFYFNLGMSILLYGLIAAAAPAVASFYHQPQLVLILRVLALAIIINSFGLVQRTMLIKKINFKTQTKISIFSATLSGIVAIAAAYNGMGVWSLVIQSLLYYFLQSLFLSLSNHWVPSLVFSTESFRRLFGFGWKLLVSGLISILYHNLYYVIIGRYFSAATLGYYSNANKLRDLASHSITISIEKVSYPVLSRIRDREEVLRRSYRKLIRSSVFLAFPLMIGLAAVAEPFILVLFGSKWAPSVPYFQILCIAGMLYPLNAINLNILQVKGRSDLFLRLEIYRAMINVSLIIAVLLLKFGILGLVWSAVAGSFISYFINSYYSAELIGYPLKNQLKDIFPAMGASSLMGILVYFAGQLLHLAHPAELILQVILGVLVYGLFCFALKMEELKLLKELWDHLKGGISSH